MGGGKTRENFCRNTPIVRAKNVGKKIVAKYCEKTILYSYEYRDLKMGGEKSATQFFQNHTNDANKKFYEKNCS